MVSRESPSAHQLRARGGARLAKTTAAATADGDSATPTTRSRAAGEDGGPASRVHKGHPRQAAKERGVPDRDVGRENGSDAGHKNDYHATDEATAKTTVAATADGDSAPPTTRSRGAGEDGGPASRVLKGHPRQVAKERGVPDRDNVATTASDAGYKND
jgi:hypothetical protein